jgi:hypothetical protein
MMSPSFRWAIYFPLLNFWPVFRAAANPRWSSWHQALILDLAPGDFDPVKKASQDQFTLGYPIPHQADHVGAGVQKTRHQPAPQKAGGPGNQRRPVLPER